MGWAIAELARGGTFLTFLSPQNVKMGFASDSAQKDSSLGKRARGGSFLTFFRAENVKNMASVGEFARWTRPSPNSLAEAHF